MYVRDEQCIIKLSLGEKTSGNKERAWCWHQQMKKQQQTLCYVAWDILKVKMFLYYICLPWCLTIPTSVKELAPITLRELTVRAVLSEIAPQAVMLHVQSEDEVYRLKGSHHLFHWQRFLLCCLEKPPVAGMSSHTCCCFSISAGADIWGSLSVSPRWRGLCCWFSLRGVVLLPTTGLQNPHRRCFCPTLRRTLSNCCL